MNTRKNRDPVLHERKSAPVTAPALWLGLIAIPIVLGLLAGLGKSNTAPEVVPPPAVQTPASNTRGRGIGDVSANNPIIAPAMAEKTQLENDFSCDFEEWVGQEMSEEMIQIIKDAQGGKGRPFRILPPGSAMTMDHSPARVNFDLDDAGNITRVWCG